MNREFDLWLVDMGFWSEKTICGRKEKSWQTASSIPLGIRLGFAVLFAKKKQERAQNQEVFQIGNNTIIPVRIG